MKRLLLVFATMIISCHLYAQNIYYDAITLSRFVKNNQWPDEPKVKDSVVEILAYYCKKDEINTVFFSDNPFIRDFASNWSGKSGINGSMNAGNILSSISGLDVTKYADVLATFIIDRAKEELSIAFFDKFKDALNDIEELNVLFPSSVSFINYIESYSFNSYLGVLREAFHDDILNLPMSLPKLRDLPKYSNLCSDSRYNLFFGALIFANGLMQRKNPAEIIYDISNDDCIRNDSTFFSNSIKLVGILSEALRDTTTGRVWVSKNDLSNLIKNDNALKIFLGLIYQRNKIINITFSKKNTLEEYLNKIALDFSKVTSLKNLLTKIIVNGDSINKTINKIKSVNYGKSSLSEYFNYSKSIINIIDTTINETMQIFNIQFGTKISNGLSKYLVILNRLVDIYDNIDKKNYFSAIMNSLIVLDSIIPKDSFEFREELFKYGTFMASIVQAKTSEEAEAAIESIALPVGSYRIKRNSSFSIELNSYIGVGGYYHEDYKKKFLFDISTPIGLDFSTGLIKLFSFSLFFPIIDLGPVVNTRLIDSDSSLPDIKLGDILAPGISFALGCPDLPVSFGVVYQYSTILKIDKNEIINKGHQWRWNLFLAVDIPLLNFYTIP